MTHTYELAGKSVKELNADINAGVLTHGEALALVQIKLEGNMRDGARRRWTRVAEQLAAGSLDVGLAFTNGNKPKASKAKAKPKASAKPMAPAKPKHSEEKKLEFGTNEAAWGVFETSEKRHRRRPGEWRGDGDLCERRWHGSGCL